MMMSDEITAEEKEKQEKIKLAIKELIENEIFQMTGKRDIMKIIRAELRKQVKEAVKFYLSQVIPSPADFSEIVRKGFLELANKRK